MKIVKIISITLFLGAAALLSSCEEEEEGGTSSVPAPAPTSNLVALAEG